MSDTSTVIRPDDANGAAPDFVVIDVETACSRVSSICQVGIVGFRDGREIFEYETLIDPRDEFHAFNTRIHGIAEHHVAGMPTFGDVHGVVDGHLSGRTTVAHSYFDKGALAAACRIHDRPVIETVWLDSVRVAQRAWPDLASHRLGLLAQYLGIEHRHHDALSDARAAGWVIVKAIDHTGIALDEWLAPPRKPGPAPRPASAGPLSGERIAILGEPRDGPLAHRIAALGGRIVSAVGNTTTALVIAGRAPFAYSVRNSGAFRRAEQYRRLGGTIRIVSVHDFDLSGASMGGAVA
jgi:DNA polymerase-3 subunit epsilon